MTNEEKRKEFVRDVCSMFPRPKSEIRRRLNDLLKAEYGDLLEEIKEYEKKVYEAVGENRQLDTVFPVIKELFKDIKKLILKRIWIKNK